MLPDLTSYNDIIGSIENIEFVETERVSKLVAKVFLRDSSFLWIKEIRNKTQIVAYSYYWFRSDNSLIIGWDNAPHHKEIETFPHHKHFADKIEPSFETDLNAVLDYIRKILS